MSVKLETQLTPVPRQIYTESDGLLAGAVQNRYAIRSDADEHAARAQWRRALRGVLTTGASWQRPAR